MQKRFTYALITALMLGGGALAAQTKATATNVATIPHEAVANFFKNPPGRRPQAETIDAEYRNVSRGFGH